MNLGSKIIGVVALSLLFLSSAANAAPPPGIPDGWSSNFVYANGIRIHYYRAVPAPGKPVLVMAHGATDNGLCWTTLTWKLQDSYDIYMVDARGHGLSDPTTPADDRDTAAKDLVGFLQALKLEKPILMGHSMGSGTVMRVAADYPDLAKAVVLLDPNLSRQGARGGRGGPTTGPAPTPARSGSGSNDRFRLVMSGDPQALIAQNNMNFDELVAICRSENPKWDIVDCQYWALSKKQFHGRYGSPTTQPSTAPLSPGGAPSSDTLARIQVPGLILKADGAAEVRRANDEAAKVMPKGKLVHIDGAAHNLHHDDLKRTVEVLKEFFATL